ncbi:MAG: phospholipase D-like domain-containing protein [Pseudomonadota bacterium]
MKIMKRLFFLYLIFCTFIAFSQNISASQDYYLVESTPIETDLDNPDIPNTLDVWIELFNSAQKSIDLSHFILDSGNDEAFNGVLALLKKKSEQGVKIRLLYDQKKYSVSKEVVGIFKKFKNCEVRAIDLEKLTTGILHTKYIIVDNKRSFVGSQNFLFASMNHIHETGLYFNGTVVTDDLIKLFNFDWELADKINKGKKIIFSQKTYDKVPQKDLFTSITLPSLNPEEFPSTEAVILDKLKNAKKNVYIQLYSIATVNRYGKGPKEYSLLFDAIVQAGKRGVKVSILAPDWCMKEPKLGTLKKLAKEENITVKFVTIPQYSKRFIAYARVIHSKYFIVDSEFAQIGTSNWEYSYFYNTRNVEINFTSPKVISNLEKIFNKLWNSKYAYLVDVNKDYKAPKVY